MLPIGFFSTGINAEVMPPRALKKVYIINTAEQKYVDKIY